MTYPRFWTTCRVYKSSSSFTSGISITYAPSMVTRTSHGECASGVIVGARFPPQVFVRAADAMPVNIHDLLPANGRFKVLVFVGDYTRPTFATDVWQVAEGLTVLPAKCGRITASDSMDVVTILAGKQDPECLLPLPSILRPHWSR